MLLQIPLALHLAHMLQLKLMFLRWRLAALCAERRLPCQWPGERDDRGEVHERVIERRAVVLDVTQRNAVRHHYHVLPFVGEVTERLWCVHYVEGRKKDLQSAVCFHYFLYQSTYILNRADVLLALRELVEDRPTIERAWKCGKVLKICRLRRRRCSRCAGDTRFTLRGRT